MEAAVNGKGVKTSSELTREVARGKRKEVLSLDLIREGKRRMIEVRTGVRPSEAELAANDNAPGGPGVGAPGAAQSLPGP